MPGEHQPRHGRGGFVRPAEGPPDFVFRFLLGQIVREIRGARRMHPDRLVEPVHGREKRLERRIVERLAGDVGVDLHAQCAVLQRALGLAHAAVRRDQRRLRDPAGKLIGIFRANLGEAVIHQLRVFLGQLAVALGHHLQRRHRVGNDLRIVLEAVDDLAADIEVMNAGNFAHALADIGVAALDDLVEIFLRNEVGIGVDTHEFLRHSRLVWGGLQVQ